LSVERIFARSVAAAVTSSGAAMTNDIPHLPPNRDHPADTRGAEEHPGVN
jgi:hypothetical protein